MARVLVTDGEQRAALAVVRSLGRAGHRVDVCSPRRHSLAGVSRYASAHHTVAEPLSAPESFVDAVARIVRERAIELVIPVAEPALFALLPARHRLGGARIPFPVADAVRRLHDKREVLATASALGIAVPGQRVVEDPSGRGALRLEDLSYPVVVKPTRSVVERRDGERRLRMQVRHAADRAALEAELERAPAEAYPLLVQQRVVGPGVGVFLLLWGGEVLASFSHRRIREKPPSGGESVYRESRPVDPGLLERSRTLLERFEWSGVAMVEYKCDAATGTPYLMEINGRFWGSLQLAVDAGVDFPALLVAAAQGEPVRPVHSFRTGVRSRWWWGDVDHLLARLRRSPAELALPPGEPGRLAALREFLSLWRPGDRSEVFRFSDPIPSIRESIGWFSGR